MCGIAGYFLNSKVDKKNIFKMIQAQNHRGPDGQGFYYNNRFIFILIRANT